MTKKELRAQMQAERKAFESREGAVREASDKVWRQVEAMDEFARGECVLVYMSIAGEVETGAFLERWHGRKRLVIPLVRGCELELREYNPAQLVSGYRGILEPGPDAKPVKPEEVDLALVPGVAFARKGNKVDRMGRGGGYYDRLLSVLDCPKIGICLPYRVVESVPVEEHDISLDWLCDGVC